jgi:predicted PurR-regulated permease PerM
MSAGKIEFPSYFKYTIIVLGAILTFHALIEARMLLIPFSLSMVFALLLYPFSRRLERMNLPRSISTLIAMVLVVLLVSSVVYILSIQIGRISEELPTIEAKLVDTIDEAQLFLEEQFEIDQRAQTSYLKEALATFFRSSSAFYKATFSLTAGLLNYLVVVPIALFFMLYYRSFFKDFLYRLIPRQQHDKLAKVLFDVQQVIQSYIVGLFTVIAIVAVLNTLGLYFLGIEHAVFFGLLASLLTIIPYVGVFIGSVLPIIYALITTDSLFYPLGVLAIFWGVQILEGNFITPNVVGSKVSLNPFAAIVALLIGGKVWGPAGMILFIPFMAMLKVIFDAIEPLKPYGFLLGVPEVKHENKIYRSWYVQINRWWKR